MKLLTIALRECIDHYNYFMQKTRNRIVRKITESALQNLDLFQAIEGARTSAAFEKKHLRDIPTFKTRKDLFKYCLNSVPEGLALEFGTYKGNSINLLAKLKKGQHFYGFDSFEGLPETWTMGCRKGAFSIRGKLPPVRDNVTLIKGFFDKTLSDFVSQHKDQPVAFLHIDCDLYSSTKTVLETLHSRLVTGTIICFDEYYNYPDWAEGEYRAFIEFAKAYNILFEYIGYIRAGSQVALKILNT
ncbi:MAG TPA: class I SAM-dependent methyltransferase [Gammaproteobacteria bacterium]|nr:class I SAM-dependent methyltransferase [Gammaproteobacteria bacterium]